LRASFDDGPFGLGAVIMGTRRVAEFFFEERPHGRNDFRVMRGGGVIIKVDGFGHDGISPWSNGVMENWSTGFEYNKLEV